MRVKVRAKAVEPAAKIFDRRHRVCPPLTVTPMAVLGSIIQGGKPRRALNPFHSVLSCSLHPLLSVIFHPSSSNNHLLILREFVLRHRQIQRRRALSRTPGDVVVRAVAGAEPAPEVARFANGDTAEVCAHACHEDFCGQIAAGLLAAIERKREKRR